MQDDFIIHDLGGTVRSYFPKGNVAYTGESVESALEEMRRWVRVFNGPPEAYNTTRIEIDKRRKEWLKKEGHSYAS